VTNRVGHAEDLDRSRIAARGTGTFGSAKRRDAPADGDQHPPRADELSGEEAPSSTRCGFMRMSTSSFALSGSPSVPLPTTTAPPAARRLAIARDPTGGR
jgi:hypothetical protein